MKNPHFQPAQSRPAAASDLPRRDFIKQGTALAALASSGWYATASFATESSAIDLALFDDRYSDSKQFAEALRVAGARSLSTGGDLGRLWYGTLRGKYSGHSLRIAGMTTHSDLILMQGIAVERGARLLYQGCHDGRGASVLTHTVTCNSTGEMEHALQAAQAAWPARLASMTVHSTGVNSAPRQTARVATPRAADHPGTLWSWVIG